MLAYGECDGLAETETLLDAESETELEALLYAVWDEDGVTEVASLLEAVADEEATEESEELL